MMYFERLKRIRPIQRLWGRGVTAALRTFNPASEGSSRAPTRSVGPVPLTTDNTMHWWSSGHDSAPVMRQRGFDSGHHAQHGPVL